MSIAEPTLAPGCDLHVGLHGFVASQSLLRDPPTLRPLERYRLDDMQRATLAVYEALAARGAAR